MKKFLLSMMALCALGYASAETYTITATDLTGLSATTTLTEDALVNGGFKFIVKKNGGGTAPAYNGSGKDLRLYAQNTLQIEANGANITAISFDISTQGLKRLTDVTPSVGAIAEQGKNPLVWGGSAADITFTVGEKATYGTDGAAKAGQFDFSSMTITTDGPVTELEKPVTPVAASAEYKLATAFAAGKYAFVYGDSVATDLTGKNYGYMYTEKANIENGVLTAPLTTTFTFTEVAGKGYTIQDRAGKYYYMTGTFNSFNVAAELPETGGYWTVTLGDNSQVTIVNTETNKTLMYSATHNSFGAFATAAEGRGVPTLYSWVKDNEGTQVEPEYTSVTALNQLATLANKTNVSMDVDLTVVYENGSYVYVYDGTNYGLVYKSGTGVEAGQVITKGWKAAISIYNNLIEVVPVDATLATSGVAAIPAPSVVEADEVSSILTVANQNVYVQINDVVFDAATPAADAGKDAEGNDLRNFTGKADGKEIAFYQRFGIESVPAGTYAVKGFISVYKENVQVYPIAFADMTSVKDIEASNAPAEYYTLQGVKVANPVAGQLYIRVQNGKASKIVK